MAMFPYFERAPSMPCQSPFTIRGRSPSSERRSEACNGTGRNLEGYGNYTAEEKATVGEDTAENRPTRAVRHFSRILDRKLSETAKRLKSEYYLLSKVGGALD